MAEGFNLKQNTEKDLMDQFLSDENTQTPYHLKLSLGRSISAPPPGFVEALTSSTPESGKNEERDKTIATKDYYYYYHSLKPHDPRLPLPTWKPTVPGQYQENLDEESSNQAENDAFSSQFDQSVNVNTTQDSLESSQGQASNPYYMQGQEGNYSNQGYRNQNNYYGRKGNQTHNGFHNQPRHNNYQQKGNKQYNQYQKSNTYDQQGQNYQQNYQAGNVYGNTLYMNQQTAYYGNPFQTQPYSYMDPNMNYPYYPNQMMGQMPMVNPMYMNQGYYNFQQVNPQLGGGSGTFSNNYQGGGSYYQKNKRQMGKPNKYGNQNFNKPYQKLDIQNVLQDIPTYSRDQNGSRLIQQHFEQAGEEERENIFREIQPELLGLMTDVFGNYVVQKILDQGTDQQRLGIIDAAKGNMSKLSQNTYSCRIVQKILEEFKNVPEVQGPFLEEISGEILPLIEDANGNHVIQKCFETVPANKLQFIIDEVAEKVDKLAFHSYGCRVIQKILECSPRERLNLLYQNLMKNAYACCHCQFGNYIMQYLIEKGPQPEKEMLFDLLKKNFIKLSLNKFASNVTEKSVKFGSQEYIHEIIQVLINNYHDNKIGLVALMTHDYGNYVIQRLFDCSNEAGKRIIYDRIRQENVDEIKKNNYGKHVMSFIENWMENQNTSKL